MKSSRKGLDPVVKIGLFIFVGSFLLIGIGMFLSRPDRTIPPYSIGSQEGTLVAVHLPPWTSDLEIQTLIKRFGHVGRSGRDFGPMKIHPTTPNDSQGDYQRMKIYIFSDHTWTEPGMLHRYLSAQNGDSQDNAFRQDFELAVRGGFQIDLQGEKGWLGPIGGHKFGGSLGEAQWIFQCSFLEASCDDLGG